jgi:NADH-quinone oxidoreductase subunit E
MDQELTAEEKEIIHHIPFRLKSFAKARSSLIPILQMIQDSLGFLPSEVIALVAHYLDLTETDVYGVATFYNQFRFIPPGKNPIKVCLGTACHVKGGDIILENFERKLEIKEGETTPDRDFSIERVACVGCCAIAPVALVSETVHGDMAPSKVEGLILRIQVGKEKKEREKYG